MKKSKNNPFEEDPDVASAAGQGDAEEADAAADDDAEDAGVVDETPEAVISRLEGEVQAERDQKLRLFADFENLRKRMQREKDELRQYATLAFVEDLLPALDNFQIGLQAADQHPEAKAVADGFRMASQQLRQILEQHGLSAVYPEGELFDPNFHECVAHQAHPKVKEDHVISVLRTGYCFHERLIRPASVIVSSGPAKESAAGE